MKKFWPILLIPLCVIAYLSSSSTSNSSPSHLTTTNNSPADNQASSQNQSRSNFSSEQTQQKSNSATQQPTESNSVSISTSPLPASRTHSESGPSIGVVKVLGVRGCPANTQGWFLSVGNPEQYNFTVSEDGETLEVESNTPNLTGQFEFIHCANAGELLGKHVQFSAKLKAQDVTQTAQLRLRGENYLEKQILSGITKVTGTYDWKDFSVESDVTPEVTLFSYGLTFRSSGKLWISHPTFEITP